MRIYNIRIPSKITSLVIVLLLTIAIFMSVLTQKVNYSHNVIDVSWPNCQSNTSITFANSIVGVNGGLDFKPNPCMGQEISLSTDYELYLNTGDPGFPRIKLLGTAPLKCTKADNLVCYSYNYGYQAGVYSVKQALHANAHTDYWFLDVETDNSWTSSYLANRADLAGMIDAIKQYNFFAPKIAIYTTNYQWHQIVGNWHINLPIWLGTGGTNIATAVQACRQTSFLAQPIILAQYTLGSLDYDLTCHHWQPPANYFNN